MRPLLCLLLSVLSCSAQLNLKSALYPPLLRSATPPADTNPPVAGFTLWLHADDTTSYFTNDHTTNIGGAATPGNGGKVGIWLDRSLVAGTNHVYQFDGTSGGNDRRPRLSNSWFNGKPAICFPTDALSSQARLQSLTNNIDFGVSTSALSVLFIGSIDSAGDSFNCAFAINRTKMFMRRDNTNTKLEWGVNNGFITSSNITFGRAYAFVGTFITNNGAANQGLWKLWVNGFQVTPDVTANPFTWQGADFFAVGANGATSPALDQWAGASIAEIVIWPFELSALQVSNVTFFATNKYGMAAP